MTIRYLPDQKSEVNFIIPFASWVPINDTDGNEVVRVGYQRWVHLQCTGFQGTDEERRALAEKIAADLNATALA